MAEILVAGLVNLETTLAVSRFPIDYHPVQYPFFGVNTTNSGVGYNIAKAVTTLGHTVNFLSLVGQDPAAQLIRRAFTELSIDDRGILASIPHTPQSVILYEPSGKRAIYTDLKDIQDQTYPVEIFDEALSGSKLAVLCNINFTRPLLYRVKDVPIATDVHAISDIHDGYNADYMQAAHILFQSHEHLPCSPAEWITRLWNTYGTPIVVIGLGGEGALLGIKDHQFVERIPAVYTRPVINTIGAGDALFSAFIATYMETQDPYLAIQRAVVFASYKIGEKGAADGFLTAPELEQWVNRLQKP